jgi:hypothetical protein
MRRLDQQVFSPNSTSRSTSDSSTREACFAFNLFLLSLIHSRVSSIVSALVITSSLSLSSTKTCSYYLIPCFSYKIFGIIICLFGPTLSLSFTMSYIINTTIYLGLQFFHNDLFVIFLTINRHK